MINHKWHSCYCFYIVLVCQCLVFHGLLKFKLLHLLGKTLCSLMLDYLLSSVLVLLTIVCGL